MSSPNAGHNVQVTGRSVLRGLCNMSYVKGGNLRRLLSMNIDDRIKEIKDKLKELEIASQPQPAPMSTEIPEAQKLKIELAELEHSYLKRPTKE